MIARVTAERLGNFYSGMEMSLAGMLESPSFLFRGRLPNPIRIIPELIVWTLTAGPRSSASSLELRTG